MGDLQVGGLVQQQATSLLDWNDVASRIRSSLLCREEVWQSLD